jgi:phage gp36-like protein
VAIDWTYCEGEDVINLLGFDGVEAFASHDERGSDATLQDCVEQGADEINLCVLARYPAAAVKGNRLLKRWNSMLAAFFVCERRGNPVPASIAAECERIMARLEDVRIGKLRIPGVPMIGPNVPALSNLVVDRRYPRTQVRVVLQNSSNYPTKLPRNSEGAMFYEW